MNTATMPPPHGEPDLALLERWRGGDTRAGDKLSLRFTAPLRQFFRTKVRPEDVEDLIQQVWVALSESMAPGSQPSVRLSLRAYVFGISRHILFRYIRTRHRLDAIDPLERSIASLEPSLSQVVAERVETQRMLLALQGLPMDTQVLLELRYFTAMSTAELAALYACPTGTIKSRLSHARKLLEAAIDAQ